MKLHTLLLAGTTLFCTAAVAQQPYTWAVSGTVSGCYAGQVVSITVSESPNGLPLISQTVAVDPTTCTYSTEIGIPVSSVYLVATTPCIGAVQSLTATAQFSAFLQVISTVLDFNCGGTSVVDCNGVTNGPAMPGTACDDGDPATANDVWAADCTCSGSNSALDCLGVPGGPNVPGAPCTTFAGVAGIWDADCNCDTGGSGTEDCLGVPGGTNLPGTPCWALGTNFIGLWDANCNCSPNTGTACQAGFWALQAMDPAGAPVPYEIWVWNLSTGSGAMTYLWNFGDGTSSNDPFPTHSYTGDGPYELCLTIADATGCTSTACDEISMDPDGILNGMIIDDEADGNSSRANGFTINVQNPLTTGMQETSMLSNAALWPNPAADELNLALVSLADGLLRTTILDLNGREVLCDSRALSLGRSQYQFNISSLPAGVYTLRLTDHAGRNTSLRFAKGH